MNAQHSCLYRGAVTHQRLRPLRHRLSYKVFNLYADVDELAALDQRLKLFSYNRRNVFSIHDKNHGPGDGTPIAQHAWALARKAQTAAPVARIFMFCYPALFGFVFNPLTVYYGYDAKGHLRLMIYEVNNTFGERHSYVLPVGSDGDQQIGKQLYVSPFNATDGTYRFAISEPEEKLALGITLTTAQGPTLKAWFSGKRMALGDAALLRSLLSVPLLPVTVLGGIHWQALKLWLKGLRLMPRPAPPADPASFAHSADIKSAAADDPLQMSLR
jgi:DUF1365 family protein